MSLPCAVADLIPQKGKMGLDQTLIKTKADKGESSVVINADNIFLDDHHQLSNSVLIEYINQLVAATQGYNEKDTGKPVKKGLFVGAQEAEFFHPVYLGDTLILKKFLADEVLPVSFVQGIIERDSKKIAEFITKIYEVTDFTELGLSTNDRQKPEIKNSVELTHQQPPTYLASSMHRKLYSYLWDTEAGEDFISFAIACPDSFDAFDGHFPGKPILPGIILLEIANLALSLLVKKPIFLKSIKKMKISGIVLPNQVITVNITIGKRSGSLNTFSAIFKEGEEREISRFSGTCDEGTTR